MKKFLSILFAALLFAAPALANLTFTVAATGNGTAKTFELGQRVGAQLVEIRATGTFGGTTITVQTSSDGGTTWLDAGVSFTADAVDYAYLVRTDMIRVVATGGSGINVIVRIR